MANVIRVSFPRLPISSVVSEAGVCRSLARYIMKQSAVAHKKESTLGMIIQVTGKHVSVIHSYG